MPLLEQVLEKYPKDVKLVYKSFPLKSHKFAAQAVQAAFAAGEQGKFWQFHDKLFENYSAINEERIRQIALDLGLDLVVFNKDMRSVKVNTLIRRDVQEASTLGVRGTPTVFVNGRRLTDRSLEGIQELIERELKGSDK